MALLASATTWGMFLFGLALLIVILLKRSYRYYGRRADGGQRDKRVARAARRQNLPLADAPPEILRWQVEMHDTARDLKAELDSKMRVLQSLIRMAGQERERLEAAVGRAEQLGLAPSRRAADAPRAADPPTSRCRDDAVELVLQHGLPEAASDGHRRLPATAPQRSAIYALADQGESPRSIAERVGAALGDVELILSLRGGS